MKSMGDVAEVIRKRMESMVAEWKSTKEACYDVKLDIWYDDSKPYFTRVPWKGGMALEGDDSATVPLVLLSSWALKSDEQAVRTALDDAYSYLMKKVGTWE